MDQTAPYVEEVVVRRRRRGILTPFLMAGLLAGAMAAGASSLAVFTDSADVTNNAFNTGSIDINASPATAVVGFADMMPGDSITGELTIDNDGASEFRYAMSTAADDTDGKGLRDELQVTIKTEGSDCATFDGTTIVGPVDLATAGFGDAAQGADAGDRVLAGGASEILCVRVELPLSADPGVQAASTTAVFTFDAEQTANNP